MKMKESMRPLIAAAAVLAIAYLCRLKQGMHPNYFCSYLRSSLHTIFFTVWGFSLYRRIIQSNVRKYLVTVSALMVVWIILKTLRYFIFVDICTMHRCSAFRFSHFWHRIFLSNPTAAVCRIG